MRRVVHARLFAACVLLGGCEYDLDVGLPWQIDQPRVIGARMVVVELAPIWEQRVGFEGDAAPIAEALPGDLVELQALAVDAEGRPRAVESIDALWFQCEFDAALPDTRARCIIDGPTCESLDEWTTDVACELGRGGALQFRFPTLGPWRFVTRSMPVLGIIAREPGVDAERCRTDILASTNDYSSDPDRPLPPASKYEYDSPACSLVETLVPIGPRWALAYMAEDFGFEPEVPLEQIPYPVTFQPANRVPMPGPLAWFDPDTGTPILGPPFRVQPGQRVLTTGPNWRALDFQPYATPREVDSTGSFVFLGYQEGLGALYLASGPIGNFSSYDNVLMFTVDEQPSTSIIRIVALVGDHRLDDQARAVDMLVSELEVVP